ncbi:hypothetical protein E0K83_09940 [Gramella sp. BOM4]|nr:hypothetical protein [Christiangramia bathymodioli]
MKTTITTLILLITLAFKSAACECPEYRLRELDNESYNWSDVIVIGDVVKTGRNYKIRVRELLKGNTKSSVLNGTIIGEDEIFNSCTDHPNEKGKYLFYLKQIQKNAKTYYLYSQCLGTRRLDFGSVIIPLRTDKSKSDLIGETADWIEEMRRRK